MLVALIAMAFGVWIAALFLAVLFGKTSDVIVIVVVGLAIIAMDVAIYVIAHSIPKYW
jgi:hypothetical protein